MLRAHRRLSIPRAAAARLLPLATIGLVACSGPQSTLDTAGVEAARVATLFWIMAAGTGVIWLIVMALMLLAARLQLPTSVHARAVRALIAAGIVWPLLTLTPLLVWGLSTLSELRPAGASLRIAVIAERWWWRVHYPGASGPVHSANEIRLPVGARVALQLDSRDVIHSLWIPALAGKMDMLPGRRTELVIEPTRTGRYRGVCAEYCGSAHAQMALEVEVMEPAAFERWLQQQAADAPAPRSALGREGARHFAANGCGGCHAIRGTAARGTIGPDLTHLASRLSLAAGELPNDVAALQAWIAQPHRSKPGVLMPGFAHLPSSERAAIAAYLGELR